MPAITCGIDWAEKHHDIAIVGHDGRLIAKKRIIESCDGFAELVALLAEAGDRKDDPIPVAIETPRGLLVAALRATGRPVYPINPRAVARYRERHTTSQKKSDHFDAMTLANILRTDAHMHRRLSNDSELARSIAVLARAHQDATWRRTHVSHQLRTVLREYYPGFLHAFATTTATNLTRPEARTLLALAATPALGARLTKSQIADTLRQAGRQRGNAARTDEIHHALRQPQLRQPPLVEEAMGTQALALLATLDAECGNVDRLATATGTAFAQHGDHDIIVSFTGLADTSGARLLAEIGDDRTRFTDARGLKAYAGAAPVTKASGRTVIVMHRRVKNDRLATVGHLWAFVAAGRDGPARTHYLGRRARGDHHQAALRHLFNRMLGQLHHCLQTRQLYDPVVAYRTRTESLAPSSTRGEASSVQAPSRG